MFVMKTRYIIIIPTFIINMASLHNFAHIYRCFSSKY